jgi:glutamate---cysteine ligase / carboxylate-amine ligase
VRERDQDEREVSSGVEKRSMIPEDAFEQDVWEGTLGAEEELWLADPETTRLAGGAQKILARAPEGHYTGELIDCEIESNTGVHEEPSGVLGDLVERRRYLLKEAERLGRLLGTSGTHPIGDWHEQEIIDQPHYRRLEDKLGWLIKRNNTFALHTHYAVKGREKVIYLYNRLREYVPHFLALSVNSPFWQGRATGLESTRLKLFDSFPRSGLPPAFASWDEFRTLVERAARTNSFPDHTFIWWDLRPHPKLGTIEVRICDAQTRLASTGALAALVQALAATLTERLARDGRLPIEDATLVAENRWRAIRRGLDAELIWLERDEERPARDAVRELVELARPAARRLGADTALAEVERILERGTGADEQRRARDGRGSLLGVAQWLVEATTADV